MSQDVYTHGHHESVLRSHKWRTAENSAAYLVPELGPGQRLLDLGCGPATITSDLSERVAPGFTLGVDAAVSILLDASAEWSRPGLAFGAADAFSLPVPDDTFDVAHAHQVLQHLARPVEALAELGRVLRPGGIVAVRDSDYGTFAWSPADPVLDRWLELYHEVTKHNGGEADAGRFLPGWVTRAGFDEVRVSTSTWTYADPGSREWWGGLWSDRIVSSSFASQAVDYGFSDVSELEEISDAWRRWAEQPDGFFMAPHVEVIARKPL